MHILDGLDVEEGELPKLENSVRSALSGRKETSTAAAVADAMSDDHCLNRSLL